MRGDRVSGECAIPKDSGAGRREFERVGETRRGQENGGAALDAQEVHELNSAWEKEYSGRTGGE